MKVKIKSVYTGAIDTSSDSMKNHGNGFKLFQAVNSKLGAMMIVGISDDGKFDVLAQKGNDLYSILKTAR